MSPLSNTNKRKAENTLLLYFRMLFMMVVLLYTSRVILNVLGVKDFGILYLRKNNFMMNDFKDIKVAVAGTGYVGLSIATLLSQHHHVSS